MMYTDNPKCEGTTKPELVKITDRFNQNLLECEELMGAIENMLSTIDGFTVPPSPKMDETTKLVSKYTFLTDMNDKAERLNSIRLRMNEVAINLRSLVG